jgi:hypothetical protein
MRRAILRLLTWILLAGCGLGGEVLAQNREKAWEVTPYAGFAQFGSPSTITGRLMQQFDEDDTARIELDDAPTFGLRFAYHWTKRQMVEFGFSALGTDGSIDALVDDVPKQGSFKADILTGRVNYILNFFLHRRDKVVAFVTGGLGMINFSTFGQSSDPDVQNILAVFVGDENHVLVSYGGGIRLFGGERAGVRFEVRQVHYDTSDRGREDFLEFNVGLTIVLGGA